MVPLEDRYFGNSGTYFKNVVSHLLDLIEVFQMIESVTVTCHTNSNTLNTMQRVPILKGLILHGIHFNTVLVL